MERKKGTKNNENTILKVLKRPLVKLAILVIIIIGVIALIANGSGSKKAKDSTKLVGYQRLINVTDNTYTFLDLDGKTKTYSGYTSMNDFYYDTTCVSRVNPDTNVSEVAIINKNKKQIVKFGEYENIIQVVGGKYYKVQKDGKYGVLTNTGKVLIKPEYEYISMTTVQEATEIVFECQKDGVYTFFNENGKSFFETDVALHSISYSNKFNSDYDTIVYISVDGQKNYFDLITGEKLFENIENVDISYNILKTDDKITFYDKKAKVKTEIDTSGDYTVDDRVYFKKYIVLEQRNTTSGTRENKYTIYDSDFKKIIESSNRISPVQDIDGNVYFIINESDCVRIINENKKEVKIQGYEFNGNEISNLQYLVLNPTNNFSTHDVFDFKGNKIVSDVTEYSQRGFGLVVTTYPQGTAVRTLLLGNNSKIELAAEDGLTPGKNYIIVENEKDKVISVLNSEGKVSVNKVSGSKLYDTDKYIAVQNEDNIIVYDLETGKQTMTYTQDNFVNKDDTVNMIELKDAYYSLSGKKLLEKSI